MTRKEDELIKFKNINKIILVIDGYFFFVGYNRYSPQFNLNKKKEQ